MGLRAQHNVYTSKRARKRKEMIRGSGKQQLPVYSFKKCAENDTMQKWGLRQVLGLLN